MYWVLCQFCRASALRHCFEHFQRAGQGAPSCIVRPFICILLANYFVIGTQLSGLFLLWQCVIIFRWHQQRIASNLIFARFQDERADVQFWEAVQNSWACPALQWQHTRETQITNGNIWSLPRWPAEQLPRKLILFSLFVLWAVFWDYDYGGRQILLCSRAPTRQIFVQIIWVKSE